MIRRPPRSTQSRSSAASDVYKRQFPLCAELYAEIRYEYRIFLANLCLAVHREDLIPWCFEYNPAPPLSTLIPSSWESGTTIFASLPRGTLPLIGILPSNHCSVFFWWGRIYWQPARTPHNPSDQSD